MKFTPIEAVAYLSTENQQKIILLTVAPDIRNAF